MRTGVWVLAGWLAASAAWAGAEESILENGGFESGSNTVAAAWKAFGKNAGRSTDVARGGLYSGKVTGEHTGQPNFGGFMQDHPARPGEQWVVSVWIKQDEADPVQGKCEAFAKIEFYGKDDVFIDAMESADRVTSTTPQADFFHSSVLSVAPPETVKVRCVAMFAQYDGKSKGTVYFDDAELRRVIKDEE
jgi:hypothetical protein